MDLLAVSSEKHDPKEAEVIVRLFEAGLKRYHLRKPNWSEKLCATLLAALPAHLHPKISIHQCYTLARHFDVRLHQKDTGERITNARSRSLHQLEDFDEALCGYEYGVLSPLFPSISKTGYTPRWTIDELRIHMSSCTLATVYALGGITACNASLAMDLGFKGVVLHGSLWKAPDPLSAFRRFRKEAA